ncbi:MAG: ATP-binding protein [Pseudomonadota bacterium]
MNRAFISLYAVIVLSVVIMGWGLNQFWENLAPEPVITPEIEALFYLIEDSLTSSKNDLGNSENNVGNPVTSSSAYLQKLSQTLAIDIQLLSPDDLVDSSSIKLMQANTIVAAGSPDARIWYKHLLRHDKILMLSVVKSDALASPLYKALLVVFYVGIALVIFLWLWPLSRDAKKLEKQTRTLGKDAVPETLRISSASALYPLARAFNHMAQRLRELIASHRDMTNAVSHELRTPLARMKFSLAILEAQAHPEKIQKQHASIAQDIGEMESLIGSLLMYAGFEQNSQQLQQREGHMRALLDDMCKRFARNNPNNLIIEIIDYSDSAVFCCEWKLIETVLQNLMNNAARYARTRIFVGLVQSATEYRIFVEDDGPGIPDRERQRVFDSFVRLYSAEPNNSAGGFGLGLAIVKRIMKWHRGDAVFVQPQQLSGARAEIYWPKKL